VMRSTLHRVFVYFVFCILTTNEREVLQRYLFNEKNSSSET